MSRIERTPIESEMRESYINYAMSVIRGRAIPDARDGLKPVQRRILYAMHQLGLGSNRPHRKCARIVGETMGKYHPHGDQAIYDTLVNMAQTFSYRYPLIDGQGNFGSLDGDEPAAMRYTEARLSPITEEFLSEITEETVDFEPNFDDALEEPLVLPAKVPNLLINGAWGISVGMTTQIPPHNLGEIVDALVHLIEHPDAEWDDLQSFIQGPDLPTRGLILGTDGIEAAYRTGEGKIRVRGRATVEEDTIVITEIPFQVRKSTIVEAIANKVKSGAIEEVTDLRDESDQDGLRIVVELKQTANPQVALNKLYRYTPLEWTFGANFLVIVDGNPRKLSLKELLGAFLSHRRDVVRRRTQYRLRIAEERAHVLEGLRVALAHQEAIIQMIRDADDAQSALTQLQSDYDLTETQADAILKMRLRQLTSLERGKIEDEYQEKREQIREYNEILNDPDRLDALIRDELLEIKDEYGDDRQTEIVAEGEDEWADVDETAFIPDQDVIVSISAKGYVNAPREDVVRKQQRGGKGIMAMRLREGDSFQNIFTCNTHDDLLAFTTAHKAYKLKAYQLPSARRDSKGENLRNLIGMSAEEQVVALIPRPEADAETRYCVMATQQGMIVRHGIEDYLNAHTNGIAAINAEPSDRIVDVALTRGEGDLLVASAGGQTIRFNEEQARLTGRPSKGVIGMKCEADDALVDVTPIPTASTDEKILFVTENGFGKRTPIDEFPAQNRAGKGVLGLRTNAKTGQVVAMARVHDEDEVMVTTAQGKIIRIPADQVRIVSRYARGVKLINLDEGDRVVAIVRQRAD